MITSDKLSSFASQCLPILLCSVVVILACLVYKHKLFACAREDVADSLDPLVSGLLITFFSDFGE
jgi:hypothetical protein